jgi:hypothetical protein
MGDGEGVSMPRIGVNQVMARLGCSLPIAAAAFEIQASRGFEACEGGAGSGHAWHVEAAEAVCVKPGCGKIIRLPQL